MPDITMCKDEDCEKKERCYRYKAIPNPYWQAFFHGSPSCYGTEDCGYFEEIYEPKQSNKIRKRKKKAVS